MTDSPPDHRYEPEGLTVAQLIEKLQMMPQTAKIQVETAGDEANDPEGSPLGRVVEIQYGHDGNTYLRVDQTLTDLQEDTR